jgi:hypothetical protein
MIVHRPGLIDLAVETLERRRVVVCTSMKERMSRMAYAIAGWSELPTIAGSGGICVPSGTRLIMRRGPSVFSWRRAEIRLRSRRYRMFVGVYGIDGK